MASQFALLSCVIMERPAALRSGMPVGLISHQGGTRTLCKRKNCLAAVVDFSILSQLSKGEVEQKTVCLSDSERLTSRDASSLKIMHECCTIRMIIHCDHHRSEVKPFIPDVHFCAILTGGAWSG